MKRHKKLIIPVLVLLAVAMVLSITLAGTGAPSVSPPAAKAASVAGAPAVAVPVTAADDSVTAVTAAAGPTVIMTADFAVKYSGVGQLRDAADVVVRGEITGISYLDFNSSAYTKVTLKVLKCLKGDLAADEEITILEVGGVTTMATIKGDKFGAPTREDAETKVKVQLEGAPLAEVGDKCTYFLGTGSIGVVAGTYYVPLGAFQGKFKINNGIANRFVPDGWQDGDYTSLSMAEVSLDQSVQTAE
jgi:hypothetical protein